MFEKLALSSIRLYQRTISQVTPPACRFTPTCSQYGYDAIQKYGLWKGGWMTFRRICRCNPWTPCSYDPVP
ncbi:MAG: membrane protein insertion efficiency factor YidD [Dehalococcoidia bacterium]|nr:membrane protein insertion efficiency factor YidD [Dehalococcoidia bacterium]